MDGTTHREGDSWIVRGASAILRWRGLSNLAWPILSAMLALMVAAWKFGPKLESVIVRANNLELRADLTDKRLNSMESDQKIMYRSTCMDRSKVEQQWIGMVCPDSLYRGVVVK